MAIMPEANYIAISYAGVPWMSRYDSVCVHTIVGYAPAAAAHFSTHDTGQIDQKRDTKYQSAANLNGNYRCIAVENEDHGPEYGSWSGSNVPPFTDDQCEAIAKILVWCYQTHGIPLVLMPDSKPTSRGVSYHRQGIDGNFSGYAYGGRVPGGELWSSAYGKVCPGDNRISQLINIIIPRARVLAGLDTGMSPVEWEKKYTFGRTGTTTEFGNFVGETNEAAAFAARAVFGFGHPSAIAGASWTGAGLVRGQEQILETLGDLADRLTAIEGKIDQINSKLDQQQDIALEQVQQAANTGTAEALQNNTVAVTVTLAGEVTSVDTEDKR